MSEPIVLEEYNEDWPNWFDSEVELLTLHLGKNFTSIYHIGSTSIPGLASKPIIDIAITLVRYPPSEQVIEILHALEYVNMGEASFEPRYWFKKGDPRKYHVHLVSQYNDILEKLLVFRDRLRGNAKLMRKYQRLKLEKSEGRVLDDREYAISKTEFVQKVLSEHENT